MSHDGSECAKGAEAVITETEYLGRDAVVKYRPPKTYRLPELDAHIRSSRTRNEARIMHEARDAGVRTPCVYDIDLKQCSITMERIRGERRFASVGELQAQIDEAGGFRLLACCGKRIPVQSPGAGAGAPDLAANKDAAA